MRDLNLQKEFYIKKLYPFQDSIFQKIDHLKTNFYLTGGTALSRFYLDHRYSDDLDFFVNDDNNFLYQLNSIQNELAKHFQLKVVIKEERFSRYTIENDNLTLKLEFINDVPFYLGNINSFKLFTKVDNPLNILANKITAFRDREEPKDFADILLINNSFEVDWELIFTASQSKAAGIFPPEIAERLSSFNIEKLSILNWVKTPDFIELEKSKNKLLKDILGLQS